MLTPEAILTKEQIEGCRADLLAGIALSNADKNALCDAVLSSLGQRDGVLEEAAKVCEVYAGQKWSAYKRGELPDRANPHVQGQSDGAEECAERIRALKSHPASASAEGVAQDAEGEMVHPRKILLDMGWTYVGNGCYTYLARSPHKPYGVDIKARYEEVLHAAGLVAAGPEGAGK